MSSDSLERRLAKGLGQQLKDNVREMVSAMVSPEARIVDALFADLRDRRELKWIFGEQDCGPCQCSWIDTVVQNEIRRDWRALIRKELKQVSGEDYVNAYDVAKALGITTGEVPDLANQKSISRESGSGRLLRSAVLKLMEELGIPESRLTETYE